MLHSHLEGGDHKYTYIIFYNYILYLYLYILYYTCVLSYPHANMGLDIQFEKALMLTGVDPAPRVDGKQLALWRSVSGWVEGIPQTTGLIVI